MPAVLTVDTRSGVPIYLQIIEQIKRSVAIGVSLPGEQLPTVNDWLSISRSTRTP